MPVSAVGFDLDNTLAVPARDRETLLREAARAVGAPDLDRTDYLDAHRRHLDDRTRAPIFEELLDGDESGVSPADLASEYRAVVNEALTPIPGALGLLETLRRSYRTGLLTNGPTVAQREKLEVLGWKDSFDATVITGEIGAGKPAKGAFDALLTALDAAAEETVYVGDHPVMDVGGAVEAGLRAIQVTYPAGPDPDSRAVASVSRDRLPDRLPAILAALK